MSKKTGRFSARRNLSLLSAGASELSLQMNRSSYLLLVSDTLPIYSTGSMVSPGIIIELVGQVMFRGSPF